MSSADDQTLEQLRMDADALYHEEVFTDRRVGTIQRLTPVTSDGEVDSNRPVLYLGQTQVMTPVGALPLNFDLEADNLEDAMARFPDAAKASLEHAMDELREMQRDSASRIMTPDQLGGGGGYGGGQGGGMPGGGIQLK